MAHDRTGQGPPSRANAGHEHRQDKLAQALSDAARRMHEASDPDETLRAVVTAAVDLIPGADAGSISVVMGRKRVESQAASSELASTVDDIQNHVGEGPCPSAVFEQETLCVPDMTTESRWPKFCERAYKAGAASMLSLQLFVEGDNLGALNMYATEAEAFDQESEHIGGLFAAHAAIAFSAARQESSARRAVSTREVIGQAQGILMERHKVSPDQAFAILTRASQHTNVKLRDIAEHLTQTGELAGRSWP